MEAATERICSAFAFFGSLTPRGFTVRSPQIRHLTSRNVSAANLIDDLVDIDAQAPGLHSTALVRTFIADNSPSEFAGGVIGSVAPKSFPQMTELVRRGVSSLPLLIKHLDDKRPTKLTVGGDSFMFRYFSDEYDPKTPALRERRSGLEMEF